MAKHHRNINRILGMITAVPKMIVGGVSTWQVTIGG